MDAGLRPPGRGGYRGRHIFPEDEFHPLPGSELPNVRWHQKIGDRDAGNSQNRAGQAGLVNELLGGHLALRIRADPVELGFDLDRRFQSLGVAVDDDRRAEHEPCLRADGLHGREYVAGAVHVHTLGEFTVVVGDGR